MDQKSASNKIRIVIISGTLETSLHPVPPVTDGAPEWNVFRLAEAAFSKSDCCLDIHVISPCEESQVNALRDYPVKAVGKYHHVVFNQRLLGWYRKFLRNSLLLHLLLRRLVKLPDLISWWYLRQVKPTLKKLSPDIVFINGRPQYIRYIRPLVAPGRLWFFMRGEIGESRRYLGLLDGMIVNSMGMREYAEQLIQPSQLPVCLMPNSLGEEFIVHKSPDDRFVRSEKTILFTGRLIADKGVMELLNAFEQVLSQMPGVRLVVCGASGNFQSGGMQTPYERELHQRIMLLPSGSVSFIDYIPNTQLGKYYAEAYLAVFPSLCKESFGMVALEAMRCGTPVVASRQPGFEELVVPGKTGFLVEDPRDKSALAAAILDILQNPSLAQQMGQAGYERSLFYSPKNGLKAFGSIIQEIFTQSL